MRFIYILSFLLAPLALAGESLSYPALEVIKVGNDLVVVVQDLAAAKGALAEGNMAKACRFTGRAERGGELLRASLAKIDTLFNAYHLGGVSVPTWFEDLELAAQEGLPVERLIAEVAAACDTGALTERRILDAAELVESFDRRWQPFRERAVGELMGK